MHTKLAIDTLRRTFIALAAALLLPLAAHAQDQSTTEAEAQAAAQGGNQTVSVEELRSELQAIQQRIGEIVAQLQAQEELTAQAAEGRVTPRELETRTNVRELETRIGVLERELRRQALEDVRRELRRIQASVAQGGDVATALEDVGLLGRQVGAAYAAGREQAGEAQARLEQALSRYELALEQRALEQLPERLEAVLSALDEAISLDD